MERESYLKFETTEKVWKELTACGKSGVNLCVNRSKEEGKGRGLRYLSEGNGGGVKREVSCSRLWMKCQTLTAE